MPRDQLDLRDKTMTELMELDRETGNKLDEWNDSSVSKDCLCCGYQRQSAVNNLLADRRQIRAAMVELRRQEHVSSDLAQYEGI